MRKVMPPGTFEALGISSRGLQMAPSLDPPSFGQRTFERTPAERADPLDQVRGVDWALDRHADPLEFVQQAPLDGPTAGGRRLQEWDKGVTPLFFFDALQV